MDLGELLSNLADLGRWQLSDNLDYTGDRFDLHVIYRDGRHMIFRGRQIHTVVQNAIDAAPQGVKP